MVVVESLPENLQDALNHGVLKRLPLTFLPFVNQQLRQWQYLFPNERRSVQRLLLYVVRLSPEDGSRLFREVVELEEKMGVRHWQFSSDEQTIQNSSELARSPYFQEWRRAVQVVFDIADRDEQATIGIESKVRNRLVLLDLPTALPLNRTTAWSRWQGIGNTFNLDLTSASRGHGALESLLVGDPGTADAASAGLLHIARTGTAAAHADNWVVDAGDGLIQAVAGQQASGFASPGAVLLGYARLDSYRQNFSHEMNTMRKDLADADAVFDRLRKLDVTPWCPPEVSADPAVREFLRSLYLTGNGAVIFGNSFVEWAASEAFRRARPSLVAAKFGVRSKPKPFTGVAVFENPDQVNPLPAVDDPEGSAVDAQMLALYVWLAAARYAEYQTATVCVCLAESISQAYVVAPPEFTLGHDTGPLDLGRLRRALCTWIA